MIPDPSISVAAAENLDINQFEALQVDPLMLNVDVQIFYIGKIIESVRRNENFETFTSAL